MSSLSLPIGIDHFEEIVERDLLFVDKTLFIAKIIDDTSKIVLITRPRRFGKSLNLSMLNCFFNHQASIPAKDLFSGLAISNLSESYWKHSGHYPVIDLSLKNVRGESIEDALDYLTSEISVLYGTFKHELLPYLEEEQALVYQRILLKTATKAELALSLRELSAALHRIYKKKVIILIDEYDSCFHAAYLGGYDRALLDLMRSMLSSTLKGNPHLEKAVVTGILRVAKESLFSGFNNVLVDHVIQTNYAPYFGFTDDEVQHLLERAGLSDSQEEVKNWYDGYRIGDQTIYNPWSVLTFLKTHALGAHWVNTASSELISDVLASADSDVKVKFESLLDGQSVDVLVEDHVTFASLAHDSNHVWGLMLASGYLTLAQPIDPYAKTLALKIPNFEVHSLFEKLIAHWFHGKLRDSTLDQLLNALSQGRQTELQAALSTLCLESLSHFDATGKQPEKVYHAFVLGMIVALRGRYRIQSNRESGFGRYDVLLNPVDTSDSGIIIEFKVSSQHSLEDSAKQALEQIEQRQYHHELTHCGVTHWVNWGIAFRGKEVLALARLHCEDPMMQDCNGSSCLE